MNLGALSWKAYVVWGVLEIGMKLKSPLSELSRKQGDWTCAGLCFLNEVI